MANENVVQIGRYNDSTKEFDRKKLGAEDVVAQNGTTAEEHINNKTIHLSTEQIQLIANAIQSSEKGVANGVATLDANGKVSADQLDLAKYQTSANVDDYAALLALSTTDAPVNSYVFVADASDDETVDDGWAAYRRVASNGNASDWVKVAEGESLDIVIPDYESRISAVESEAAKLDAVYCTDESDMLSKNLRDGAIVFMEASTN